MPTDQSKRPSPPSPRVTVAMSVYNSARTLRPAIESILAQSYRDWEMIICDDGSTDDTYEIIQSYAADDRRIKPIRNAKNQGLNHALNRCMELASGEYYARMDGDDISMPERLEVLVRELDAEPDLAVVSSSMTLFDERGDWSTVRPKAHPVAADLAHGPTFCHAPCMMRTAVLRSLGGYGTEPWLKRSQDYHLWFRLFAAGHRGKNIDLALYRARDNRDAVRRRSLASRVIEARIMLGGFRLLHFPLWQYIRILRPLLLGIMPACLYDGLRRWRRSR